MKMLKRMSYINVAFLEAADRDRLAQFQNVEKEMKERNGQNRRSDGREQSFDLVFANVSLPAVLRCNQYFKSSKLGPMPSCSLYAKIFPDH